MIRLSKFLLLRPAINRSCTLNSSRGFTSSSTRCIKFDPYQVLGVDKNASSSDIKKAYYQLVKKYHPDVNKEKDSEKRFHKIQESYELLSDKEKRSQYDKFGAAGFDSNGNTNPFGGNPFTSRTGNPFDGAQGHPFGGMGFDFEDLFKQAFTGGNARGSSGTGQSPFVARHVGDNIEVLKSISFHDAVFGTKIDLNYKAIDSCTVCLGSGLKKGKKKSTCPSCHGTGQNTHVIGGFHMASTCPNCSGSGVVINKADECGSCHGTGVKELPQSRSVELPCGIADGSRLRIPGGGDAPFVTKDRYNQIVHGDLIVRIHVKKDPVFSRKDNNIVLSHDISMTTAALGGETVVPTIDGENVKLRIRPGVQSGRTLTVPQKGVPINGNKNNRGDMLINLNVKTPVPQTELQKALLQALADSFNDMNAQKSNGHLPLNQENEDKGATEIQDDEPHSSKLDSIKKTLGKFFKFKDDKSSS